MKKIILLVLSVISWSVLADWKGSIAYNNDNGRYGVAFNYHVQREADSRAIQECGSGCKVIARFANNCAALAIDHLTYGWATSFNKRKAKRKATKVCKKHGGRKCRIKISVCNKDNAHK